MDKYEIISVMFTLGLMNIYQLISILRTIWTWVCSPNLCSITSHFRLLKADVDISKKQNTFFLASVGIHRACRIYGEWRFMGINFHP